MQKSESIGELAAALAAAQAEMKNPLKDATGQVGHQKTRYADLAGVRDAVIPVLARHKLSVLQSVGTAEGGPSVTTLLMHESGEWVESDPLTLPASRQDAQGYGSAITYARRYALQALAGVTGDDDDDGAAASAAPRAKQQPAAQPQRPAPAAANGKAAPLPAPRSGAELLARLIAHEAGLVQLRQCAAGELLGHVEAAGHRAGFKGAVADWPCPGPALALASAAVREFESGERNAASTAQLEALDALLRYRGEDIEDVRAFLGIPRDSDADLTGAQGGRAALWLASLGGAPAEAPR